jgi:hypothetical protein
MDTNYQAALTDVVRRMRQNQLTSKWTALTFLLGPRRIARHLGKIAAAVADELDRIEPPADVEAEHNALTGAVRRAAANLGELADRRDLRASERFEAMAEANFGQAELRALEARGYRLANATRERFELGDAEDNGYATPEDAALAGWDTRYARVDEVTYAAGGSEARVTLLTNEEPHLYPYYVYCVRDRSGLWIETGSHN